VGLANVHRRIRFAYGASYGLTIESEPDLGTTVSVRLPADDANDSPGGSR
jgi:two-component system sensor histidine kinase YesM